MAVASPLAARAAVARSDLVLALKEATARRANPSLQHHRSSEQASKRRTHPLVLGRLDPTAFWPRNRDREIHRNQENGPMHLRVGNRVRPSLSGPSEMGC